MEQQLTLRITGDLNARLARAAKREKRTRSEVIRMALEAYLAEPVESRPFEKAKDLLGQYESGIPDLGTKHREYLIRRIRDAR